MLKVSDLTSILQPIKELQGQGHILEGNGYDRIMAILKSLRGTTFPCVILEARAGGQVDMIGGGPIDSCTQSLWVMVQLGRDEDEVAAFEQAWELAKKILARFIQCDPISSLDTKDKMEVLRSWDYNRISYMQRYGGPTCRGYEVVLTFRDYVSLTYTPDGSSDGGAA